MASTLTVKKTKKPVNKKKPAISNDNDRIHTTTTAFEGVPEGECKQAMDTSGTETIQDPIEHSLDNPIPYQRETDIFDNPIRVEDEPIGEKLTPRQEKFCQLYTGEGSFFGNGTQAYLEVYDIDQSKPGWYKTATAAAARLLANVRVCKRINELFDGIGLNKEFMDKQLLYVATQFADLGHKMSAIKEYNRITKRVDDSPKGGDIIIVDGSKLRRLQELRDRIK